MTMLGVMAEGKVNIGAPCLDGLQVLQQQTLILYPPGLNPLRPLLSVFQLLQLLAVLEVVQGETVIHTYQKVMDLELVVGHLTTSDSYLNKMEKRFDQCRFDMCIYQK